MSNVQENILDVTVLDPRIKHATIFQRFDDLAPGKDLVVHNDHDPKPLYYQMIGELGNTFDWEYLEEGPEWWKVRLTKKVPGENEETIGELAAKDLRKVEIFKKYGIDFCCGGKKTVKQACADQGIDVTKVEKELQESDKITAKNALPYNEWGLDFLADFIVNTHHTYVKKSLPEIRGYAAKVAQVHGGRHPELIPVQKLVEDINEELISHLEKEEKILFPYIKKLAQANSNGGILQSQFGTIQNPIKMMETEHETAGDILKEIRTLTLNYTLPEDACASYTVLFKMLDEFENDLFTHIHLENNILFPKAEKLEEELLS